MEHRGQRSRDKHTFINKDNYICPGERLSRGQRVVSVLHSDASCCTAKTPRRHFSHRGIKTERLEPQIIFPKMQKQQSQFSQSTSDRCEFITPAQWLCPVWFQDRKKDFLKVSEDSFYCIDLYLVTQIHQCRSGDLNVKPTHLEVVSRGGGLRWIKGRGRSERLRREDHRAE